MSAARGYAGGGGGGAAVRVVHSDQRHFEAAMAASEARHAAAMAAALAATEARHAARHRLDREARGRGNGGPKRGRDGGGSPRDHEGGVD